MNIDQEIDELLNEGYFKCLDSDTVNTVLEEISTELEKTLRTDKKGIYIKNNTITIKGTNIFNRCSSIRMSDSVEGMILRKYYDIAPNVDIKVTYFKVGTKVYKNFYRKKRDTDEIKGVNYSVGAGAAMTTSIKITVIPSKKFKVSRVIQFMNNRESSVHYEKLTEETIY